ncbi:GumC family protein [Aurantiacibacter sediminis]|uniref:Polysaccharide biosynthesis tyrosine autokinase n=1 Tax=Aurantiacibacter sediminis TaxID=2793064 RepID=A0ABS0N3A1_9SPHN|nr:polysaccharide biosynthesis tyrosine autokinase [Aurantiacibacter sediminis]MBH5322446.1 polysaccharide biosynthesis tyrosine autokinase [Aurantiacibacter sediminis]
MTASTADAKSGPMLTNTTTAQGADGGFLLSVREIIENVMRGIRKNRWWILAIIAAALILGIIIGLTTTPLYEARSQIEISRQQDNVTQVEGVTSEIDLRDPMYYQTQYELLQSQTLAERVVLELDLLNDPRFMGALEEGEEGLQAAVDPQTQLRRAGARLRGQIGIAPVGLSSLVSISYRSPDRTLAADVANAWAEQFIAGNLDRRFSSTNAARDYLEDQLGELRQRLEDSESQLVNYAADQGIVTFTGEEDEAGAGSGGTTLAGSNLQALNAELARARAERITAESQLEGGADIPSANASAGALTTLESRRAELQAQYDSLTETFLPDYPQARQIESQIAAIDAAIARERSRIATENSATLRRARLRESELQTQVDQLTNEYVGQQRAGIQYAILQREVDTNRELYEGTLQRFKEIGVAGVGNNNIAIVDRAQVPNSPVVPSWPTIILFSLLLGGLTAAGFVYIREQLDYTIQSPTDVDDVFGLPLLGSIPKTDADLVDAATDPFSEIYESYLTYRTNLNLLTDRGAPGAFMMTSTRPGEGKSFSSVMIAELLARAGHTVILVDADMRASRMNKTMSVGNRPGLSEVLTGNAAFDNLDLSPGSDELHFDLMNAGAKPPNAGDLLASESFPALISMLRERYDHVVIDGPPLLSLADAALIGAHVDGAIMVVQAYATKIRPVQNALARLGGANIPVFGVLVTKLDQAREAYGYGYGYGYGAGSDEDTQRGALGAS